MSTVSDILDPVGDKEHDEEDDTTSENEKSYWQLNSKDRDSDIQISDTTPKQSHLDWLTEPTPSTLQSVHIKDKTTASANFMRSISIFPLVPKSHIDIVIMLVNFNARCDDSGSDEPLSLRGAMAFPYWNNIEKAMHLEFQSLIENDTWEYRDVLLDQAMLTGRWVFKIEKDRWDKILKFKARWVVHVYKQQEGLDYTDTFTSVIKSMSWKSMMDVSIKRGYQICQMDVINAFLYGFLDEEIYIM